MRQGLKRRTPSRIRAYRERGVRGTAGLRYGTRRVRSDGGRSSAAIFLAPGLVGLVHDLAHIQVDRRACRRGTGLFQRCTELLAFRAGVDELQQRSRLLGRGLLRLGRRRDGRRRGSSVRADFARRSRGRGAAGFEQPVSSARAATPLSRTRDVIFISRMLSNVRERRMVPQGRRRPIAESPQMDSARPHTIKRSSQGTCPLRRR